MQPVVMQTMYDMGHWSACTLLHGVRHSATPTKQPLQDVCANAESKPSCCRSQNGTVVTDNANGSVTIQPTSDTGSSSSPVTYMVVFQEAVSLVKIEQLCSNADQNYGFSCGQVFSKTFKGFSVTVPTKASLPLSYSYCTKQTDSKFVLWCVSEGINCDHTLATQVSMIIDQAHVQHVGCVCF